MLLYMAHLGAVPLEEVTCASRAALWRDPYCGVEEVAVFTTSWFDETGCWLWPTLVLWLARGQGVNTLAYYIPPEKKTVMYVRQPKQTARFAQIATEGLTKRNTVFLLKFARKCFMRDQKCFTVGVLLHV